MPDDPIPHRSVSQYTTYDKCSEAYRLERVARAPQRPAAWFHMGSAFHEVIEEYERDGRALTLDAAQDRYRHLYQQLIDRDMEKHPDPARWLTGGRTKGETDIANRKEKGAEQVATYYHFAEAHSDEWRILPLDGHGPAVEIEFNLDFGGVNVKGFIDQIRQYRDGTVVPVDLKTGSKIPDNPFQLAVYAHAMDANMGILPRNGIFWMGKHGRDETRPLHAWNKQLLDSMFQSFDKIERAGIYNPSPGDSCRTCPVMEYCRVQGVPELAHQYAHITTRTNVKDAA